ncbi:hypothetical protein AGR4A_Cc30067 [Agrobacterium tumefaciens str. B6]|uniref:Uncharacterized protein n=1 Tax=Agrobacterium tumefaciens str. B6 TaxID=1183423 RepID=A0A822V340_AGRTU|nr:hypothetical protein AGR4A_Cc30067 [Agrobacterium tumefaciens str. B6]
MTCRLEKGQVAEWFKAHAWNACVRESVPWVRIPPCPPFHLIFTDLHMNLGVADRVART